MVAGHSVSGRIGAVCPLLQGTATRYTQAVEYGIISCGMSTRIIVAAGAGDYPRLVIEGAKRAGVENVTVIAIKGSTAKRTKLAADEVREFTVGSIASAMRWASTLGADGIILAGQINPLSLFRGRFEPEVKGWLASLKVKTAHTIFGKLIAELEKMGLKVLPASCFMEESLPGEGLLTSRAPTEGELSDIAHARTVAGDMGRHDVGQTVMVKDGMVLSVEAFEGTNAAIRRGGRLGGKGSVVFKAARTGHDMRFDIPVVGLKTLKTMRKAGATALAFQAGRLILLEREKVIQYADRHGIAIVGIESGLPHAPVRP